MKFYAEGLKDSDKAEFLSEYNKASPESKAFI